MLSSDREPSSARRRPPRGPQVMAWAQGPGKAQGTLHPQPKDGGPHKNVKEKGPGSQSWHPPPEGSPASEAGSPLRPREEPSVDSPLYPREWYGAPATERPFSVRWDNSRGAASHGTKPVGGSGWPRPLTEEAGRQGLSHGSRGHVCRVRTSGWAPAWRSARVVLVPTREWTACIRVASMNIPCL